METKNVTRKSYTGRIMWGKLESWFVLGVDLFLLSMAFVLPIKDYLNRDEEDRLNLAAQTFNALSLEERQVIASGLFPDDMNRFDFDNYVFEEKHSAPRSIPGVLIKMFIWLTLFSMFFSLIYCAGTLGSGYFLADLPVEYPYWLPWVILLYLSWPFLLVSAVRMKRYIRKNGGEKNDKREV